MKILQITPIFLEEFGGVSTVVRHISKELAKEHDVTVYTTVAFGSKIDDGPRLLDIYSDNYRVIAFPRNFNRFLRDFYVSTELGEAIKENLKAYDIVHIHSWRQYPPIVLHYYAKKYKIPYVFQAHGALPRLGKRGRKWVYDVFFGYKILHDASKVVALNKVEARQCKAMGVPEEKIEIIPNGIDLSEFAGLPPKGSFKKKFSIDDDEKIVLYLGRIHRIKGIDILIKAFANIVEKLDDVKLVVVGPDDGYLSELEALIKALKMEDNVLILGPLYGRDKLEAYVDADVYTLPSRYEMFPMSVLEALACGTPIILTENCGTVGYIRDKVSLVVKPDPNHLYRALLIMLQNQKKHIYREYSKSFVKKFNIFQTVSKLEKIYEDILQNAG